MSRNNINLKFEHWPMPLTGALVRSMKTNLRVVWMVLVLANTVAWAQELPTLSRVPDPAVSALEDFRSRLQAAVESGEVANIKALYQTNGVTAQELESEVPRWQGMMGQGTNAVSLFFKELDKLPSESRRFWSAQAHWLTVHEVTHFVFLRRGNGGHLILPLVIAGDRLLIVPSEKVPAKGVEPGRAASGSQPIRSETNTTSSAAGSRH